MDTISWIIFAGASVAFWIGAFADANSSKGQMEQTKFFRKKDGRFNLQKYLLTMAALQGAGLAITLIGRDVPLTLAASGMLIFGAVMRFRVAARNRAKNKQHAG